MQEVNKPSQEEVNSIAKDNASRNPEMVAVEHFRNYYPMYKRHIMQLNKKDLERLCDALIAFPLEMEKPRFNSEAAKVAFGLGHALMEAKMMLRLAVTVNDASQDVKFNKADEITEQESEERVINKNEEQLWLNGIE
jgi:hypothetical protein